MRFHCLGVQHTITNKEYIACAFTQKVLKFCEMMTRRGHTVFHYGHEDSNVLCTEHVTVMSRDVFNTIYGVYDHRQKLFTHDQQDQVYTAFNQRAIEEIRKRKQPGDFLLAFWGVGHRAICDAHQDLIVVEPGIGYTDTFAPHKVFESYAVYHAYLTLSKVARCFVHASEYERDAVIPNYFDPADFDFTPDQKEDYFLFVGRIGVAKGLGRAIKMTQRLGVRLIVAGQNAEAGFKEEGFWPIPDHVTHVGYVGVEERKHLMAHAKAVVCFSTFVEPFCGVHVEAMMSGTPVISSDWGAMTEFNVHGFTGFRCRTLDEMVEAGRNIHTIHPENCRSWAMSKFSTDVIAQEYERYFARLKKLSETIDYDRIQAEEQPFADRLGPCLVKHLQPKKFLDIGCGPGMHVRVMDSLGVESLGIEPDTRASHPLIKNVSMFDMTEKADLVMSLEVAEHLPASQADDIVRVVTNSIEPGGTLVWTAAHPGQGGVGHINCQPKEYWIEKFTAQGLVRDETLEEKLKTEMRQGYHMGWFVMNLVVFRKSNTTTAIWTDPTWALGRIAKALAKNLEGGADIYDFRTTDIVPLLEKYNRVIAKSDVFFHSIPDHLKKKLVVTIHCPTFEDPYFREYFEYWPDVTYTGVSQETCEALKTRGVSRPVWTPYGADLDIFTNAQTVSDPIRRIGITGGYHPRATPEYIKAKGLRMFEEICRRIGAEPVFLMDRKDEDIYKDIDLLICCSEFEAGPLGVFEAAACGVPVLTRRVGNAQYIKGIATFDTVDDAVQQIQTWDYQRSREVTHEVRTEWSMKHLIQKYPLIPRVLDFIEIGTSDFDTEIEKAGPKHGISVEPIKRYLDKLPDLPHVQKVHAAISNYDGHINIYSVEDPEKYGMPSWIRGCNSVNTYHPTTLREVLDRRLDEREVFTVDRVRVMTFSTLVKEYNISACRYLKIDTEGHDIVILESYLESGFPLIPVIRFEANSLTDHQKVEDIQTKLRNVGYTSFVREGDNIIAFTQAGNHPSSCRS